MNKIVRLIHRWTGLVIGLFFFISCLSGLLIVFGKIIGSYAPIFKFAGKLHTSLFLGEFGSDILAIATLLALVEIITGYWLWGKELAALCRAFQKKGTSRWKAFVKLIGFKFPNPTIGLHNGAGFWAGIPLLIMVVTCLPWCFEWCNNLYTSLFESSDSGSWDNNLFHSLHALHVGSWGRLFSRLLWFVTVILGGSLPITGLMIYLKKKRHH